MTKKSRLGRDAFWMGGMCSAHNGFGGGGYATQCH